MYLFFQSEAYAPWLAPYAYFIVLLGFCFFLFRIFENWYATIFDRPLFRNYWVYKKLSSEQNTILENDFGFFVKLSDKHRKQFSHRVAQFMSEKKFIGRGELAISERMKLLVSAIACMISFGRKNYSYILIDYILLYPDEFYSAVNSKYHKGEFNPREKALVLSWNDFETGLQITNDNLNVGIHEFMHAMQLEASLGRDLDSSRFSRQFQKIIKQLTKPEIKEKLETTRFFRAYAFTNQYEFMAVLAEYFFESPKDFKTNFPQLYDHTKKLLNFNFAGY